MLDVKLQIEKILAGDKEACQSLVEEYQRLVSHIVFRMVSNQADREDICQDVFLKVYQNLKEFRSESKISTWVAKIAYNTCINYLEKKRLLLWDDVPSQAQTPRSFPERGDRPDCFTEEKELTIHLHREIEKLPVHFRTILTLYHLDGMSYNEIGKITGMPEGTVKSYLFRARRLLKERLSAKYQPEDLCR
jgi:RNA polymerase sigma factor (sigma-70 family)